MADKDLGALPLTFLRPWLRLDWFPHPEVSSIQGLFYPPSQGQAQHPAYCPSLPAPRGPAAQTPAHWPWSTAPPQPARLLSCTRPGATPTPVQGSSFTSLWVPASPLHLGSLTFPLLSVSDFSLPLSWIKLLVVMECFSNTCVPGGQNRWTLL